MERLNDQNGERVSTQVGARVTEKIVAHRVVSHFGVQIETQEDKSAVYTPSGRLVLPEDSYGFISCSNDLTSDKWRTKDQDAHALLCKAYGLASCMLVYDRPDFPNNLTPPHYLLMHVDRAGSSLGKRVGFEVVEETMAEGPSGHLEKFYLMKGDSLEVQERLGEQILNLSPKTHEDLATQAERAFPDFWRDPVKDAKLLIVRRLDLHIDLEKMAREGLIPPQRRMLFGADATEVDLLINGFGWAGLLIAGVLSSFSGDKDLRAAVLAMGALGYAAHMAASEYFNRVDDLG